MIYLVNDNSPELVLKRSTTKVTRQSIHTTNGEVFKFRLGWREATVNEYDRIAHGTYPGIINKQ